MGSGTQSIFSVPQTHPLSRFRSGTNSQFVGYSVEKQNAGHLRPHRLDDTTPEGVAHHWIGSQGQHVGSMSGVL